MIVNARIGSGCSNYFCSLTSDQMKTNEMLLNEAILVGIVPSILLRLVCQLLSISGCRGDL